MRVGYWLIGVVVAAGCGGQSTREQSGPVAAGGTTPAGGATAGGEGGGAGAPTKAPTRPPSFVPDDPGVSKQGDGRVWGGSFEGNLGDGWDFCCSNPMQRFVTTSASGVTPVDGEVYLGFDSSAHGDGVDRGACPDTQLAFWPHEPITDPQLALYFDVVNLGVDPPSGRLQIDAIEGICVTSEPLAVISLAALAASGVWQTRCVTLTPQHSFSAFGLELSGAYDIGLDAFRFGPPCHAP